MLIVKICERQITRGDSKLKGLNIIAKIIQDYIWLGDIDPS